MGRRPASLRRESRRASWQYKMAYYVYLLLSEKDKKSYVGSTDDLEKRLEQHNKGLVISTRSRRPLKLIYKEEYQTEVDARIKERYYKTASGRRKLRKIFVDLGYFN